MVGDPCQGSVSRNMSYFLDELESQNVRPVASVDHDARTVSTRFASRAVGAYSIFLLQNCMKLARHQYDTFR